MTTNTTFGQESTSPLLGIWAHPDDEAFLSAGLMAVAAGAGKRVVVATATRGEHGPGNIAQWTSDGLAARRERELAASLAAVDVHEHRWLGHRDGELSLVPRAPAVAQIGDLIDSVEPDTIVTFGPDGMTGHDDHRTVSSWVTQAWQQKGRRARLWYATLTPTFHEEWGEVNERVGLWLPGARPPVTPPERLAAHVVCDGTLGERKYASLRAHASQTDGLVDLLGEETFRSWWATECFVEAAPAGSSTSAKAV